MINYQNKRKNIGSEAVADILLISIALLTTLYERILNGGLEWASLFIITLIILVKTLRPKERTVSKKRVTYMVAWLLYLLWVCIGIIYSVDLGRAFPYLLRLMVFVISLNLTARSDNTEILLKIIKWISVVSILSIIAEMFVPDAIAAIRTFLSPGALMANMVDSRLAFFHSYNGIYVDASTSAFFCAVGCGIGIYLAIQKKWILSGLMIFIAFFGAILTYKRGPLISMAISSVLIFLICNSQTAKNRSRSFIIIGVLGIAAYTAYMTIPQVSQWVAAINANKASTDMRANMYTFMLNEFLQHPILGYGTKSVVNYLGLDGHNIYLTVLFENGIIGEILVLFSLVFCAFTTYKKMQYFKKINAQLLYAATTFCLFGQLYFMSYGMTGNPLSEINYLAFYFLCVGIPIHQYQRLMLTEKEKEDSNAEKHRVLSWPKQAISN